MSDIDDELFALAGGAEDADVEEGEASSVAASSPNSLGSDAMEESDSEAENDNDVGPRDTDVPYPLEGKYVDAKDKARILGLPQLEREAILGERAEEQNKAKFQAELARRARDSGAVGGTSLKRKASSSEPEDSMRKSTRQKIKPKTNDRLEAYKRNREQQHQQRQRNDDRRNGRRRSSSGSRRGSDVDAEGESEVEYAEYSAPPRQEQPADLQQIEYVRLGRGFFSQYCFTPGIEEALTGCFVRMGAGQDSQKRTWYRMAQIKGFTEGKPYVMDGKHGKRIGTNQYIIAQHGSTKKNIQLAQCSNDRFTQAEFDTYRQALDEASLRLPTESTLRKKYDDIKSVVQHHWTDADISESMRRKQQFEHLTRPRSGNQQPKLPTTTEEKNKRIAEFNRKTQRSETERIRQVLADEQRRQRKQREAEMRKKKREEEARKKAEEEKAALEALKAEEEDDLFGEGEGEGEVDGVPLADAPKEVKKEPQGIPTFRKPKMEDDILASMDIGVEIEI